MHNIRVTHVMDNELVIVIDRWATRSQILAQIRRVLRDYGVPARSVDRRIPDALRLKKEKGLSYRDASREIFGHTKYAERLRAWNNQRETTR